MTFSAGAVRGIVSAVRTAQNLVQSVQESIGFDRVLAGEAATSALTEGLETTQSLLEQTADAIRKRLTGDGLAPVGMLTFTTRSDGSLKLETRSDRAAAIESATAADSGLRRMVARLHASLGATSIDVGPVAGTATSGPAASVELSR